MFLSGTVLASHVLGLGYILQYCRTNTISFQRMAEERVAFTGYQAYLTDVKFPEE